MKKLLAGLASSSSGFLCSLITFDVISKVFGAVTAVLTCVYAILLLVAIVQRRRDTGKWWGNSNSDQIKAD